MAAIFYLPRAVAINDSGRPYPGALANFYLTGTNTRTDTFTSSALTTPHSNPVQADSAGLLPAIYLDPEIDCKLVLTQANGTLIYSVDPANNSALSQSDLGQIINPLTAAEIAASVTPLNFEFPEGHVYRYGTNAVPGATDMAPAINNAILVMAAHSGGGQVTFPADNCRIASTINAADNVTLVGHGGLASKVYADNCDGITLTFESYYGHTIIRDLYIEGVNSSSHYGIKAPGTLDDGDEINGMTLERVSIRGFNVGVHTRTVRMAVMHNCRIEDVDRGIELIGKNIVWDINDNKIIRSAGGGGSGAVVGITINSFNYTSGAGIVPSEGQQILNNLVYGFATALLIPNANFVNIIANDLYASVIGIDYTNIQLGMNIVDNYFDLNGAALEFGIYGRALGSPNPFLSSVIARNYMTSNTSVSAIGIKINDSGNGNQDNVTIEDNYFVGFNTNDILVENAGPTWILRNRCKSSGPTNSISVPVALTGPVFIEENTCTKAISYDTADVVAGRMVIGPNVVSATSKIGWKLYGSATYDPASLGDGTGATTTVTVTGAALGDAATATFSLDLQGITLTAWVSAANGVSVRFQNESGGTLDLSSGTLRAEVRQRVSA